MTTLLTNHTSSSRRELVNKSMNTRTILPIILFLLLLLLLLEEEEEKKKKNNRNRFYDNKQKCVRSALYWSACLLDGMRMR